MEGMFDDDPDLDDLEVQQDLATNTETTETDTETGASPEDALTLPPGVVRGTITDPTTGAVQGLSETERSYKKSRFVPDETDTSPTAIELRDLRSRYIEQLATPEERNYWNPEVGPKPVESLSASALRKFFELKAANPDLVIGESLEDANRFSFYTYGDQNAQFQARKAVSDAVLETIRSPNQASPGWTVEITDPEAPSTLGFGERKVTFNGGEPRINMQTLLQQAVQNFEREGYQQNLDAGQSRQQALMNSLLPTLEALKNNGYAIKVRDADGNVVDAVERPDIATSMPIVRGERGAFVSAEQVLRDVRVAPREGRGQRSERLTESETNPQRATLGDESPEVTDQTELERMMEQTDPIEGAPGELDLDPELEGSGRKLPPTRINIEEARTGFTETLERRGAPVTFNRDRARQVQIEQAERNQAARAAEPTTTTPRPTQIEEGIEASDSAANLFDLQQAAGNTISGPVSYTHLRAHET